MIELLNNCYMYLPKQEEQQQKHHKSNEQKTCWILHRLALIKLLEVCKLNQGVHLVVYLLDWNKFRQNL